VVLVDGVVSGLVVLALAAATVYVARSISDSRIVGDPVEVIVDQRNWTPWQVAFTGEFADPLGFEEETAAAPPYPDPYRMLRDRGAVDFPETKFHLIVRGRLRRRSVVVTDLRAHVVQRGTAYLGEVVGQGTQGDEDFAEVDFDLESHANPISAREFVEPPGDPSGGKPYFERRQVRLKRGEEKVFYVHASTKDSYCQWNLRVEYRVGRKTGTIVRADRGGTPFQTTAGGDKEARLKNAYWLLWSGKGIEFYRWDISGDPRAWVAEAEQRRHKY
jgi:hypothetical protein